MQRSRERALRVLQHPLMLAIASREYRVPARRLSRAASLGKIRAVRVGHFWFLDRESVRLFAEEWHRLYDQPQRT